MDGFSPRLLDLGLKAMVGKGPRSKAVVAAIIRNKAIYLQAFGGCGALYASTVKNVETLAFEDLGPEALLRLTVEDFPVIVAIDSLGGSVYTP
jgi:fumarate hydratase subunit beta